MNRNYCNYDKQYGELNTFTSSMLTTNISKKSCNKTIRFSLKTRLHRKGNVQNF